MHTRTTATALALLFAASSLTGVAACGEETGPKTTANAQPNVNRMEHEARRHLVQVQEQQQRNLNPNEHLGLEDAATAPASANPAACRAVLTRAWQRLGHYSDGYERYLLRQPPCAGLR